MRNDTDARVAARTPLYLDDFTVGEVYRGSGTVEVDTDAIKRYAREYDMQPFHLDEAAAKHTLFGGLAASGWHTASLTMRLLVEGGVPIAGGIIGAGAEEMRWPRRCGRATAYASNPKCSRYGRRARSRSRAS